MKRTLTAALTAVTLAVLAACSSGSPEAVPTEASTDDPVTVTIGVTDINKEYWTTFTELAAEEGITVELKNFTDYQQPNPALSNGQLDLNQFQHLLFLANYNENSNDDLVAIGSTVIYQLGLYTDKDYATPDDIPEGAQIAIPNDATNQARALLVLQSAGLITLKDGGNALSTPADVVTEESRVQVVPVDANQTAVQLRTLDAAVINNNFAADAQLDPTSAIYSDLDDTDTARPYVNIFAARAEDADNPLFATLVEIYHRPEVIDQVLESNEGTAVEQDLSADELATSLTELQDLVRDAG